MHAIIFISLLFITTCVESDLLDDIWHLFKALLKQLIDDFISSIVGVINSQASPLDLDEPIDCFREIIAVYTSLHHIGSIDDYVDFLNNLFTDLQLENPFGKR